MLCCFINLFFPSFREKQMWVTQSRLKNTSDSQAGKEPEECEMSAGCVCAARLKGCRSVVGLV